MTQQSGNQLEEGNSFPTDPIDLFEITGDDDSPIARLKAIVLSIDWEINNEILQELENELLDLGDIWAGEKIKQVYIQGLSKIGKYISKEKAGAHPDAIKLLISFYQNLEKIVSADESMSEEEKKQLLLSDVKKFDQLKSQIGASDTVAAVSPSGDESSETADTLNELKTLKAQVLGIDWEINDQELQKLAAEVQRLESLFAQDKAKLILLQGIGALSTYINKMRSKSKSHAFTLLHSFYNALEKISGVDFPAAEEKQLLLSEVGKFNEFKNDIAEVKSEAGAAAPIRDEAGEVESAEQDDGDDVAVDVNSRLSSVFGDDDDGGSGGGIDESDALAGVNVETEADDDSDEDALPYEGGTIAPALSEVEQDSSFSVEKLADDLAVAPPSVAPEAIVGSDIEIDEDAALLGVDVETEADDDSDEESLPIAEGELAPALTGADDEVGFDADSMFAEVEESDSEAIENRLGAFFDDEVETSSEEWSPEKEDVHIDTAEEDFSADEESIVAALSEAGDDVEAGEEGIDLLEESDDKQSKEDSVEDFVDEELSFLDDDDNEESEQDTVSEETEVSLQPDSIAETGTAGTAELQPQSPEQEALAFFDDTQKIDEREDDDISPPVEGVAEEDIALQVDSEPVEDEGKIEFTVPGEETDEVVTDVPEKLAESDDSIEFEVPGDVEGEKVVFEVAADDAELDLLPGEEYADSESLEAAHKPEEIEVELTEVLAERGRYEPLSILATALQSNVTQDTLQDLFVEVNKLRSSQDISYIDKTFLQLLSTVGQSVERHKDAAEGIPLMQDLISGLVMSESETASSTAVQQSLFNCTSRVLLFQSKDAAPSALDAGDKRVVQDDTGSISEKVAHAALGEQDRLASFVHRELADVRKLFVDEIGSLRKELAEKEMK